jgi:hypothetical protein
MFLRGVAARVFATVPGVEVLQGSFRWVTSGSNNPGPVNFFLLDETSARRTIAELQLAE